MAKVRIDSFGNKRYYDGGFVHRDDGPAIIYRNGVKEWYHYNKLEIRTTPNGLYIKWSDQLTRFVQRPNGCHVTYKLPTIFSIQDDCVWPEL